MRGCWWCWGLCARDAETHASYQRKRYRNDTNYPTSTPSSQCPRRIGIPFYNCFYVTMHMFSGMNKLCAVYALGYALGRVASMDGGIRYAMRCMHGEGP